MKYASQYSLTDDCAVLTQERNLNCVAAQRNGGAELWPLATRVMFVINIPDVMTLENIRYEIKVLADIAG